MKKITLIFSLLFINPSLCLGIPFVGYGNSVFGFRTNTVEKQKNDKAKIIKTTSNEKVNKTSKRVTGKFIKEKIPYSNNEQAIIDYKNAMQLLNNGDRMQASIFLHQVLEKAPSHTNARIELINYYRSIGEITKAEELLQQGLELNDKEPIYIKQQALLLNEKAKYNEALSLLLTMPKIKQDDLEYRVLLALTYLHEGIFDLAKNNYNKLLRLEPKNSNWRLGLAVSQDAMGDYSEALKNFIKARNLGGLNSDTIKYIQQRIDILQQHVLTMARDS
jgi:tetratricopeptide (TPR) repeat protein